MHRRDIWSTMGHENFQLIFFFGFWCLCFNVEPANSRRVTDTLPKCHFWMSNYEMIWGFPFALLVQCEIFSQTHSSLKCSQSFRCILRRCQGDTNLFANAQWTDACARFPMLPRQLLRCQKQTFKSFFSGSIRYEYRIEFKIDDKLNDSQRLEPFYLRSLWMIKFYVALLVKRGEKPNRFVSMKTRIGNSVFQWKQQWKR